MSETMSLLLATSVLALGGMGLYLFKSDDSNDSKGGSAVEYDEDVIFKNDKENGDDDDDLNDEEDYEKKPRKRSGKTKRTKKSSGTKRRY